MSGEKRYQTPGSVPGGELCVGTHLSIRVGGQVSEARPTHLWPPLHQDAYGVGPYEWGIVRKARVLRSSAQAVPGNGDRLRPV